MLLISADRRCQFEDLSDYAHSLSAGGREFSFVFHSKKIVVSRHVLCLFGLFGGLFIVFGLFGRREPYECVYIRNGPSHLAQRPPNVRFRGQCENKYHANWLAFFNARRRSDFFELSARASAEKSVSNCSDSDKLKYLPKHLRTV